MTVAEIAEITEMAHPLLPGGTRESRSQFATGVIKVTTQPTTLRIPLSDGQKLRKALL